MPEWEESRSTKTVERNACGQWDVMGDFGIMVTSKASFLESGARRMRILTIAPLRF